MNPKQCFYIWKIPSRNSFILLPNKNHPFLIQTKTSVFGYQSTQYPHQTPSGPPCPFLHVPGYQFISQIWGYHKTHRLYKANNHMSDAVPPPTPGGYRNMASSYDVCVTDNMNLHQLIFPPTAVSFPNNTNKQDKATSLSAVPNLQVGQSVTHIDSNGTQVT